jgi:hypothetical protein
MAHKGDYIPSKDADFNDFFKNILDYVDQRTAGESPEWDLSPPPPLRTSIRPGIPGTPPTGKPGPPTSPRIPPLKTGPRILGKNPPGLHQPLPPLPPG